MRLLYRLLDNKKQKEEKYFANLTKSRSRTEPHIFGPLELEPLKKNTWSRKGKKSEARAA